MADERDAWLDQDAAENLLRGEAVGPVDDHARERARKVARALDALRAAGDPAPGGLPGEEAALAAFRAARAERASGTRAAMPAASAPRGTGPGTARDRSGPGGRTRWARPVRWGLAASVAGLAVGGVAVGAGTGVLPVLGGDAGPLPASSVSAAATPDVPEPGASTGEPGAAASGTPGDTGSVPPSASATPGPGTERVPGRPDPGTDGGGGDDEPGDRPGGDAGDSAGADTGASGSSGSSGPSGSSGWSAGWLARTAEDCRDYRDGSLDRDRRERLATEAKGAAHIRTLCDKVLAVVQQNGPGGPGGSAGTGSGGSGDDSGSGGGTGTGGDGGSGEGDGDDDGRDGGDSGAARPPVSWRPPPSALSVRPTGLVF
ncbi:hypothetical protein ACF068_03080 [Streptomyces sp. NPDC016309]|uniref:hypothetical protein n=1 Tax=Streptomyces sp. NPDC016309 TaxID=3364965 RepID=UPI0036F97FF0